MGSPLGGSFFNPYPGAGGGGGGACDGMLESLAAYMLGSLQFSYLLMKGFSSTSRALKDVGNLSDRGFQSSSSSWGRAGSGRCSLRVGRSTTTRSSSCIDVGFGEFGKKQQKATRKRSLEPRASGNGSAGQTGAGITGSGECKGAGAGAGGTKATSHVERTPPGDLTQNGSCSSSTYRGGGSEPSGQGSTTGGSELNAGLDFEATAIRHPSESAVVSKFSSGLTNRTASITRLTAVDGVSFKGLKPMGKGFAKGVKMASGVVKGVKTATGVLQKFSAPAESVVMGFGAANGVIMGYEAAKFIVSSAKISKDFVSVWKLTKMYRDKAADHAAKSSLGGKTIRERFAKGLKASDGALTLLKLTREFSGGVTTSFPSGLSNWDLIAKGYEVSSGVLKVSEVALGWKGGMVSLLGKGFFSVKGAVSGIGVVVKTVVLTKEISVVILKGIGLWKGGKQALKVIREKRNSGDFLFFKAKKKDSSGRDGLGAVTIAFPKAGAEAVNFPIICDHPHSAFTEKDPAAFSLILSLASLLCADLESFKAGPSEDFCDHSSLKMIQPYALYLALPG